MSVSACDQERDPFPPNADDFDGIFMMFQYFAERLADAQDSTIYR